MEFEILYPNYPTVGRINVLGINSYIDYLYVNCSPLANCQTYFLGGATGFASIIPDNILKVLKLIYKSTGKRQCVIDLNKRHEEDVINALSPFIEDKAKVDYISTNGSEMVLYVIKFKPSIENESK